MDDLRFSSGGTWGNGANETHGEVEPLYETPEIERAGLYPLDVVELERFRDGAFNRIDPVC